MVISGTWLKYFFKGCNYPVGCFECGSLWHIYYDLELIFYYQMAAFSGEHPLRSGSSDDMAMRTMIQIINNPLFRPDSRNGFIMNS